MQTGEQTTTPTQEEVKQQQAQQEEQAAFESSFKEARGEPLPEKKDEQPAKVEATAPVAEAKTDPAKDAAAQAEAETKKWDGVPQVVRETLESISTQVGSLKTIEQRLQSVEGRTGAALNGLTALKGALDAAKAASASGAAAPTGEQIAAATASSDKWKTLKSDFPEWADAMEEQFASIRADMAKGVQKPVDTEALKKEVSLGLDERVAAGIDVAEERAFVRFKHPQWKTTVNTPAFKAWMDGQPAEVKALAASDLADDAVSMLDKYSAHVTQEAAKTKAAAEKKTRLEQAVQPQGTRAPVRTVEDENDAFVAGFNAVRGG